MDIAFKKYQFLAFSLFTILLSVSMWIIAKEQSGMAKMLLNQLGYFAPAFVAIVMTLFRNPDAQHIKLRSYMPFIAVILCILIISVSFGENYYQIKIDKLLYENPLITIIVSIVLIYFIIRVYMNMSNNSIDRLIHLPKTKIVWYLVAIAMYPLVKFAGVLVSIKLFPTQIELPGINPLMLVPIFLFSIIFYAGIGEEVGWRGFALKKLQMKYNPFVASLFIGMVWSIWHIGYFTLVENYQVQQIPGVIIWTLMSSFFCTWLFNKTKGNVLILILFHASINFAILFAPHPAIMFAIHVLLLILVLSTGRFFKKLDQHEVESTTDSEVVFEKVEI